jgi:NAD(P)-dependent dehydrogenase (short-subunit alcohol dehydrogenase family)
MVVGEYALSGKIAVVTGAGSGINLAFAKLAEQGGAKVIIADVKLTTDAEDFMRATAAKGTVISVHCDVTKRVDLENLAQESEKRFGDVPDVWIAGAGVFEPVRSSLSLRIRSRQ